LALALEKQRNCGSVGSATLQIIPAHVFDETDFAQQEENTNTGSAWVPVPVNEGAAVETLMER
jgi:hypothetical protein